MAKKNLVNTLTTKATDLRDKQAKATATASALIAASNAAAETSVTASVHAAAVEQAVRILEEAGVVL